MNIMNGKGGAKRRITKEREAKEWYNKSSFSLFRQANRQRGAISITNNWKLSSSNQSKTRKFGLVFKLSPKLVNLPKFSQVIPSPPSSLNSTAMLT